MADAVKKDLRVLFEILNAKETTDEGNVFRTTEIHTCRADAQTKLEKLLPRLRKYAMDEN